MLEYIEPRHQIPLACSALGAYHNTTSTLLPAYLHAASGRRLQIRAGKLRVLSRQRPWWIDEQGKATPYIRLTAFSTVQRLRYIPFNVYQGYCETEQAFFITNSYGVPTTCPNDPSHVINKDAVYLRTQGHDIEPVFLILQLNCQVKVTGKVPYTLPMKGPLIDIISTTTGTFATNTDGIVYYMRTIPDLFVPSGLHDGFQFAEIVVSDGANGIFTAGITFDNKLMVRGQYRKRYYPIFYEVPWPE